MFIIVWRHDHREPFIDTNSRGFIEQYSSYEEALNAAKEIVKNENENEPSPWYFNFEIYELKSK